ncbi:UDP-N-acetylmuramate--L-alanine ligase [bacterium]|nr:UDP-N-acetylmuramate--L-alanine ligase [bacterium]
MFKAIDTIHFIGIGGSGMSGLAEVLLNLGYKVTGSDIKRSATIERLISLGAKIYLTHAIENVAQAQVVVVSSAIDGGNPEIRAAQTARIPIIHRSEMLAELMRLKYGVVVAGTHGKTTTTSIMANVLHDANLDPTVVIGGILNSTHSNAQLGQGDWFLAEADESDGSFLRLSPTVAVVTNIDKDHMDHYSSYEEILAAFRIFLDKVPFYGAVCACVDDPGVRKILPEIRRKCITYGLEQSADISAIEIQHQGSVSHFKALIFGQPGPVITLSMPGRYNVLNALASLAVGVVLELPIPQVCKSISSFAGVLHRFTQLGQVGRTTIVDDYAHNPKKISTVLDGIRESWPHHKVCAIFQPHRYSRVKHLAVEFSKSFTSADSVIVTPVYAASEKPIEGCDHLSLAQAIRGASFAGRGDAVLTCQNLDQAVSLASSFASQHDGDEKGCTGVLLITLGAGDVQQVGPRLLEALRKS